MRTKTSESEGANTTSERESENDENENEDESEIDNQCLTVGERAKQKDNDRRGDGVKNKNGSQRENECV